MNLYEILHVSQSAPEEIIKLAYKGLVQKYHPDRYKGKDANEIMVRIRDAYDILIDPIEREKYDKQLAEEIYQKKQQEELGNKKEQDESVRRNKNSENFGRFKGESRFKVEIFINIPEKFSISNFIYSFKEKYFGKIKKIIFICIAIFAIFAFFSHIIFLIDNKKYANTDLTTNSGDYSENNEEVSEFGSLNTYDESANPDYFLSSPIVSNPVNETNEELDSGPSDLPVNDEEKILSAANNVLNIASEKGAG